MLMRPWNLQVMHGFQGWAMKVVRRFDSWQHMGWLVLFWPVLGQANGRELSLRAVSMHELAIVRHPHLDVAPQKWPSVYVPRFGLHATYHVLRQAGLGFGIEAGLPRRVLSQGVSYRGAERANLWADYHDILLPVLLEGYLQNGSNWSWSATLAMGLALTHWQDAAAYLAGEPDRQLPLERQDVWTSAWFGRLAVGPIWRASDNFALRFGGSVGCKQHADLHVGLFLEAGFAFGAGPGLNHLLSRY